MRVCLLVHEGSMFSGGQGVYLSNLARALVASGHEVEVISGPPYPDLPSSVRLHRVRNYNYHRLLATGRRFFYGRPLLDPFHPLNAGELVTTRLGMFSVMGAFSIRAYQRLRDLIEAGERFDVVHDNQVLGYGTLLIRTLGLPVVATVHHPLDADRANRIREAGSAVEQVRAVLFYPFFMQRIVLQRVDGIVAVSASSARQVARAFELPAGRVRVVWNGVDGETFRRLSGVEPEPGRLLFVGDAEDRNKGFRYLLEALQALDGDWRLAVVQRAWSKRTPELARELDLAGRVEFLDSLTQEELVEQYNRAQLFVSPSLFEGFGLPAAEAQACGTPAVVTSAGAHGEIVADGESGLVVPPGDAAALGAAIAAMLAEPARARAMGEAGAGRVRERFSWQRAAEAMTQVYEEARCARVHERTAAAR